MNYHNLKIFAENFEYNEDSILMKNAVRQLIGRDKISDEADLISVLQKLRIAKNLLQELFLMFPIRIERLLAMRLYIQPQVTLRLQLLLLITSKLLFSPVMTSLLKFRILFNLQPAKSMIRIISDV